MQLKEKRQKERTAVTSDLGSVLSSPVSQSCKKLHKELQGILFNVSPAYFQFTFSALSAITFN